MNEAEIDVDRIAGMMEPFSTAMQQLLVPPSHWSQMGDTEHFVQFYDTDSFLLGSVSDFVKAGFAGGDVCIVIARQALREGLEVRLRTDGVKVEALTAAGRYIVRDAGETLTTFAENGIPEPHRFVEVVGGLVQRAAEGRRRVRIFGEMVALLWADGQHASAIRLEELWNDLQKKHSFSLFCAYPMRGFEGEALAEPLGAVCATHARVIPAESYSTVISPDERLRAIALLQQKAQSLETEIAERKEAEQRFRFLAESMPQKIFTARPDGAVDYCNEQWTRFTGLPCEDMENWGWAQVIHPDDVEENIRRWQQSITTGEPFEFEHRFRRSDGAYHWHLTRAHAMRDPDGSVLMWIGSHTDIDDQKRREAELHRSIRHRDEFLASISHDLKTPLTVLQGQAQVLQRRAARGTLDEEAVLKALNQIESRSRMMTRLIDELLDVTLLRAGEDLHLDRRTVDLVAVVHDAVARQQEATDSHRLVVLTPESKVTGKWDRLRLGRVLENLISNAIKYSPNGGDITVELVREEASEGNYAVVIVRDQGLGIPSDDLPHIFERLYRGQNTTDGIGGMGLGLAAARQIVEQHGGTITAESREGSGSTFTIRLPVDPLVEHET